MIIEILKVAGWLLLGLGGLAGLFVIGLVLQITSGGNPWE
jgi:hypothetical protein